MRFGKFFGKSGAAPGRDDAVDSWRGRLQGLPAAAGEALDRIDELLDEVSEAAATLAPAIALGVARDCDAAAQSPRAELLADYFAPGNVRAGSFALLDRLAGHAGRLTTLFASLFSRLDDVGVTPLPDCLPTAALSYLRAWGLQRRLARFRQRPLGKLSWQQAHTAVALLRRWQLFPAQAEAAGEAQAVIWRAYLQVVYEETVPWGNLTPPQQALAARLIEAEPALGWTLAAQPGSTHLLDLAGAVGPCRLGAPSAPRAAAPAERFLNTSVLQARAEQLQAETALPAWLTDLPLDSAGRQMALRTLASHWSATPPRRLGAREERYRPMRATFGFAAARQLLDLTVAPGHATPAPAAPIEPLPPIYPPVGKREFVAEFNRAYAHLNYGDVPAFEGRADDASASATTANRPGAMRQHDTAGAGPVTERWIEIDHGDNGIGVLVPAMLSRHVVGTLVAWRMEDESRWHLGIIRRAGRDARERPTLGIELLPEPALPAVVHLLRPQTAAAAAAALPEWVLAVLAGDGASVWLPAGSVVGDCPAQLISDRGERAATLGGVIERGPDWERVALLDA